MSDSESDIEIKSALPKKKVKKATPQSPSDYLKNKKISTKMMITDALTELKTRKGVSLYAIKKYLTEKYNVNTDKVNYLIKKSLKAGVEDGTFIQMKGIGASGSFKLAVVKPKPKPKKKPEKSEMTKTTEKTDKQVKKPKTESKKKEKTEEKGTEKNIKKKVEVERKEKKTKKVASDKEAMKKKLKIAKGMQTPAKKRAAMMRRKSIGSIIKPPKMKPKSQA